MFVSLCTCTCTRYATAVLLLHLIFRIHACFLMISLELISWSTISISTEIVMNEKNLKVSNYLLPCLVTYHVVHSTSNKYFNPFSSITFVVTQYSIFLLTVLLVFFFRCVFITNTFSVYIQFVVLLVFS